MAQVSDGTTTRLYLGDIVFNKASNGTVTLESAGWEGGRLLPGSGSDKVLYVVKDHLGSVRVVKDGMGNIRQRFDYYPYGTVSRMWTASSTTDSSEKRYRFGGKEIAGSSLTDLAGIGAAPGAPYLDFGARLYSPGTATWMSPDPLMEKYYGIGANVYCTANPVNMVDPDGREMGDKETLWYCLKHPYTALRIGNVKTGSTNISTNSVRFATRGEILYGSKPQEQEERGSEAGAFRHALWQAAICSIFGGRTAIEVGYAHEDNVSSFDYTKMKYESITEADMAVDLFNNQVGRTFSSEGMDMKQLALKLLDVFESLGLYTAKQVGEEEWVIERSVLDEERAKQLRDIFMQLDKNGFYEAEQ